MRASLPHLDNLILLITLYISIRHYPNIYVYLRYHNIKQSKMELKQSEYIHKYVEIQEASRTSGVERHTIRRLCRKGLIACERIGDKKWVVGVCSLGYLCLPNVKK